jgi:hypothetical protein
MFSPCFTTHGGCAQQLLLTHSTWRRQAAALTGAAHTHSRQSRTSRLRKARHHVYVVMNCQACCFTACGFLELRQLRPALCFHTDVSGSYSIRSYMRPRVIGLQHPGAYAYGSLDGAASGIACHASRRRRRRRRTAAVAALLPLPPLPPSPPPPPPSPPPRPPPPSSQA